jgi:glycosyltransferase involved in cell wall biosynthesis
MKLSIYVHEFQPQIGHSRALIELLNGLLPDQKNKISHIEVVSFIASPLEEILPDFNCPKKYRKVPLGFLKPFILKMFFYHLYSLFHSVFVASQHKKIGIGIACLNVDIVNIQFLHRQWESEYFKTLRLGFLKKTYKKLLNLYFSLGEDFIYTFCAKKIDYIVIAKFMKEFLTQNFKTPSSSMHLIPSGVNISEFNFSSKSSEQLINYLQDKYPVLKSIDPKFPIALFVGAYERKGLDIALDALSKVPDCQFIIIGKPEQFSNFVMPKSIKTFQIEFTKEVHYFYELSDLFIFPTKYEPFGLVIIEAYVMGMDLIIPSDNVGASEIIPQSEGIYFIKQNQEIILPELQKIPLELKKVRRAERLKNIENYSWKNASKTFYSMLFKY